MTAYSANRSARKDRTRVVVDLPERLVGTLDKWGVSAGMTSRRETVETLLSEVLSEKAAGSEFGDHTPAAEVENAA